MNFFSKQGRKGLSLLSGGHFLLSALSVDASQVHCKERMRGHGWLGLCTCSQARSLTQDQFTMLVNPWGLQDMLSTL